MSETARACFIRQYPADFGVKFIAALQSEEEPPADLRDKSVAITKNCLAELGLAAERENLLGPYGLGVTSLAAMVDQLNAAGLDPKMADAELAAFLAKQNGATLVQPPSEIIEAIVERYIVAGVDLEAAPSGALNLLGIYVGMAAIYAQSARILGF